MAKLSRAKVSVESLSKNENNGNSLQFHPHTQQWNYEKGSFCLRNQGICVPTASLALICLAQEPEASLAVFLAGLAA